MITIHHELGAVAELDVRRRDLTTGLTLCRGLGLRRTLIAEIEDDLFSLERSQGTLHNRHEALSAGIDDTRLLQHRKHLRGLREHLVTVRDDLLQQRDKILVGHGKLGDAIGHALCDRQDRTLLRLHDRLIRRLHGTTEGTCHNQVIDPCLIRMLTNLLRKATNQLAQYDTGVSACATKRAAGHRLRDIFKGRCTDRGDLSCG